MTLVAKPTIFEIWIANTEQKIIKGLIALFAISELINFISSLDRYSIFLLMRPTIGGIIGELFRIAISFLFWVFIWKIFRLPILKGIFRLSNLINKLTGDKLETETIKQYNEAMKRYNETVRQNSEATKQYHEQIQTLLHDEKYVYFQSLIPSRFFDSETLIDMYIYLEEYRADNFKEIINLLEVERHQRRLENDQRQIRLTLGALENNIAYQNVLASKQLLETQAIRKGTDDLLREVRGYKY